MTTALSLSEAPARQRTGTKFAGVAAGNFMIAVDATILNVALPDMRQDLHASAASLPWTVDAYTVTLAGLVLAVGSVADRWGPRRVYRTALVLFAVFSLLCAAAPNAGVLIAGRALLGIPAAGLVPASMALLAALHPGTRVRQRKIGTLVAVTGLGIAAGPVLGGALVAAGGWRWVFLVNPIIAVLALLVSGGLSAHRAGAAKPLDLPGLLLSVVGLVALTYGLINAGDDGWGHPTPVLALAVALTAVVALVLVERRAEAPMLPAALLRLGRVRVDLVVAVVSQLVYYGILYTLTQWMVGTRALAAFEAGLLFLPMTVPVAFVPMLTGRLVVRFGARPVMFAGLALDLLGGAVLLLGHTSLWTVFAVELLIGAGSPLAIPACIADMSAATPLEYSATGQGALNAARMSGTALGVAVFGTLASLAAGGLVLLVVTALALAVVGLAGRGRTNGV